MAPPSAILDYHERSKHQLRRYAPGPGYLDWANQPDPFRTYTDAPRIALTLAADALPTRFADIRSGALPSAAPATRESIGVLLELSLAISAWKSFGGNSWALRCNPSSGNLHPTEGYVVADLPGLAGVYHYLSRDHSLEQRARWNGTAPGLGRGLIVGLASIYWREAWKYGLRAFRYCQHDCGHAIAAVSYAAAALGWQTRMFDAPADSEVATLLGLDLHGEAARAEPEEPDCLLWIGTGEAPPTGPIIEAARAATWMGHPNRLSVSHVDWPAIDVVHAAAYKPRTTPASVTARARRSIAPPKLDLTASTLFRQRRSAVDFDAVTSIPAEVFFAMLEPLLPSADAPPWNAWPWPARVHLALFVHRVDGMEPGLYAFLRDHSALGPLRQALRAEWAWRKVGPAHLPLYLLIAHDTRDIARVICCHQDIAADSCFALGMLADFTGIETSPWLYRRLYWECGLIGQALYLEAEAAGIRATGIGCFFDDEMHRLLGLEGMTWQSLYHFTVGGPVEDTRLTTLPAYSLTAQEQI